jgi:CheY-like chemotaxis protein
MTPVEILLVEDNPADVELTLRALKKHNLGNSVRVVTDGVQALDFISKAVSGKDRETPPKVVFLDLKLPKVDGLEVLRRM